MDDTDMRSLITSAGDSLPVPWEELWAVFQKILQQIQEDRYGQINSDRFAGKKQIPTGRQKKRQKEALRTGGYNEIKNKKAGMAVISSNGIHYCESGNDGYGVRRK